MPPLDHVHCYDLWPYGVIKHCLERPQVGINDSIELGGVIYLPVLELKSSGLAVKRDHRQAQVCARHRPEPSPAIHEALRVHELADATPGFVPV